jgi:hypothetical protein
MRRRIALVAVTLVLCQPARGDLLRRAFQEGVEFLTGKASKEAGEVLARRAARAAARHGDDVFRVAARHGDDAARVLARHEAVAAPLIERLGFPAVRALDAVGPRNGRRMATMLGDFERTGRAPELMGVIGKYGDPAMEFVWKHKGALALSAGLTAFLADPEPLIKGTRDITEIAAENAVRPLATGAGDAVRDVARPAVWLLSAAGALWLVRRGLKKR